MHMEYSSLQELVVLLLKTISSTYFANLLQNVNNEIKYKQLPKKVNKKQVENS